MAKERYNINLLGNLCAQVAAILHDFAPDYEWEVCSSNEGSLIYFYCLDLSGADEYAQALHTSEVQQTTNQKRLLMRAQGEYLERYGLRPKGLAQEFSGILNARGQPMPVHVDG